MINILTFTLLLIGASNVYGDVTDSQHDTRQQRLLFYDEDGNLVKTYMNPYLQHLKLNAGHLPYYGSLISPFLGFLRELGNSLASITIPISNQVVQQIKNDPHYQNMLMPAPMKEPVVMPNPLCLGKRTQIPSPLLCNNYLNCWDGWAVEQECPAGLLFSSQGYCDYSDNVNCESRKLIPRPPSEPQCSRDFDSFRNPRNCNEFFVCVSREPVRFKCPADLAYSQLLGVCDYPSRVDCSSSPIFSPPIPARPDHPVNLLTTPALPTTIPALTVTVPSVSLPEITTPSVSLPTITTPSVSLPTITTPSVSLAENTTPKIPGMFNTLFSTNTVLNSQSWSSTHVAISRQDAIRQLQIKNAGKVDAQVK